MLILDDRECGQDKRRTSMDSEFTRLGLTSDQFCIQRLDFGDCIFAGYGEDGECMVGCERKKLQDLVTSMQSRRLSGFQLRECWRRFDYLFLIVEGVWRRGDAGQIEYPVGGGKWRPLYAASNRTAVSFDQLNAYLNSLTLRSRHEQTGEPLRVKRTYSARETAVEYVTLYKGFQKRWDEHHAHDTIYVPDPLIGGVPDRPGRVGTSSGQHKKVTTAWRAAFISPGLDRKAYEAAQFFGTAKALANGTAAEWARVPGVGKGLAEKIVRAWSVEGE